MKTEQQYFEKKASEVYEAIKSDMNKGIVSEEVIKSYIITSMKEVARDQRYVCGDAIQDYYSRYALAGELEKIDNVIQNAMIKEK